jgi:hypothetical protein
MPAIANVQEAGNPTKVIVTTKPCSMCGQSTTMKLNKSAFMEWLSGERTVVCFPTMTPSDRGVLETGSHDACFETLAREDDT